ncbi:MAG: hypothetical protein NC123_16755 [Butyrivibrio sp.]|nr:hypothetical protein [Acetatifactor muris]MCM1561168.1 hypothetical protein [Butyrivibrio sp.]
MSLFTDEMTVYNHFYDEAAETDLWQRTVIRGVQWSHNKAQTSVSGGVMSEKRVESVTIDFQHNYGNVKYLDPIAFAALEDKSGCWTLNSADGQDVLVLGESDREIGKDYPISSLRKDFQYCGTVTAVSDNRNRNFLRNIKAVVE